MIIIERIYQAFAWLINKMSDAGERAADWIIPGFRKNLTRLIWLLTARDCEHCKKSKHSSFWIYTCSDLSAVKECKQSIYRKHFERERWLIK